ncbi:hypothetical protein LCGC14_2523140, partial [marine sediment metagenome]
QLIPVDFILPLSSHSNAEQHLHLVANCLAQAEALMDGQDQATARAALIEAGTAPDEADRMAAIVFLPAVRRILDRTNQRRQTLLFSAALDGDVAVLKWTVRAVFLKGDDKPALFDNGVWELVSGTGSFEGMAGVGALVIKPAEGEDRRFILTGEIGEAP